MGKYFNNTLASEKGISGDDLNRRHRERRLGYAEPSKDWADSGEEIRCLYNYEVMHRPALDGANIYTYAHLAFYQPLYANGDPMMAPIRVIK